jgi:hypothetical protein
VVYSSVVYCPNVVVGWRSGVWRRRLCVRCEGCYSSNIPLHQTHKHIFYEVRLGFTIGQRKHFITHDQESVHAIMKTNLNNKVGNVHIM